MIGELGLDGRVRPVRGVLPAVLAAAEAGYQQVVVPEQTAAARPRWCRASRSSACAACAS